ncbi:MAG: recombinase family protein [Propionivibrio sp.]|uniref:recombinase family protein n=1 Tax=Propionivibrio sp. TaxID=2212460 RepID=UPI001B5C3D72|nr:recombinase family protein [Propionivibrio sp.]MBP7201635.1 recombinase family protein [Propionivibrio sp.]
MAVVVALVVHGRTHRAQPHAMVAAAHPTATAATKATTQVKRVLPRHKTMREARARCPASDRPRDRVTGERIRDKIAASKAKGMWMGGPLPLGYDVANRLLVINKVEAQLVRRIFDDFITMRSATLMAKVYAAEGVRTKGGKPFTKQTLYKMLHNRMYLGEIVHNRSASR